MKIAGIINITVINREERNRFLLCKSGLLRERSIVTVLAIPFNNVSKLLMTSTMASTKTTIRAHPGIVFKTKENRATDGVSAKLLPTAIIPNMPAIIMIGIATTPDIKNPRLSAFSLFAV